MSAFLVNLASYDGTKLRMSRNCVDKPCLFESKIVTKLR